MGREDHPVVQKGSGVLPGGPRSVESPTWKSGRPTWTSGWGQEAYAKGRETSGGPPGGPKGVGRTYRRSGEVERPTPRFWIGWESHVGREAHPKVRLGLGDPLGGPDGIVRPIRRSGRSNRRAGWVKRPTQKFKICTRRFRRVG